VGNARRGERFRETVPASGLRVGAYIRLPYESRTIRTARPVPDYYHGVQYNYFYSISINTAVASKRITTKRILHLSNFPEPEYLVGDSRLRREKQTPSSSILLLKPRNTSVSKPQRTRIHLDVHKKPGIAHARHLNGHRDPSPDQIPFLPANQALYTLSLDTRSGSGVPLCSAVSLTVFPCTMTRYRQVWFGWPQLLRTLTNTCSTGKLYSMALTCSGNVCRG